MRADDNGRGEGPRRERRDRPAEVARHAPLASPSMAAPSASQPTPQRLASIREQVSLLADYL